MLILTRKCGQKLIIADNIELTVVECSSGQVKIGIEAPKDVFVYREELYKQIREANKNSNIASNRTMDALQNLLETPKNTDTKLNLISTKIAKNKKS